MQNQGARRNRKRFLLARHNHRGTGVFLGATMVFGGFTYVSLGWALKTYRSRGVAVILAAISGIGIVMTARNQFFAGGGGGRNLVLALLVAVWALYACKVTVTG